MKEEIHYPVGQEDIHFIPVISGAGRGLGKILLGAALIGIASYSTRCNKFVVWCCKGFCTAGASLGLAAI